MFDWDGRCHLGPNVKNAVKIVESLLLEDGDNSRLRTTAPNPFPSGFQPELDVRNELHDGMLLRLLQLIGILRRAVELGQLDLYLEVRATRSGFSVVIHTTLVAEGLRFKSQGCCLLHSHECTGYGILAMLTTLVAGRHVA